MPQEDRIVIGTTHARAKALHDLLDMAYVALRQLATEAELPLSLASEVARDIRRAHVVAIRHLAKIGENAEVAQCSIVVESLDERV